MLRLSDWRRTSAGICSLLTTLPPRPLRRDHRDVHFDAFQGEGVAAVLVREILKEAEARRLKYVFACTNEDRVAGFSPVSLQTR